MNWTVAALYRFLPLDDLPALRAQLHEVCAYHDIVGTLLIAPEGINGTIAGRDGDLKDALDFLDARCGIRAGEVKFSTAENKPFLKLKIRIKREIITLRAPDANPSIRAGTYVEPQDWNAVAGDPDVLLLDTRNRYETAIGTFAGAVDPGIDVFTDFKTFVDTQLDPARTPKVAMFCTGGIRCEKAASFMLGKGFAAVYHLKGGILKYLETVPPADSLWQGDCYVFDRRVAVGQKLAQSVWRSCFGCGHPLAAADCVDAIYEEGVACRYCHDGLTSQRADRLRMRHIHLSEKGHRL